MVHGGAGDRRLGFHVRHGEREAPGLEFRERARNGRVAALKKDGARVLLGQARQVVHAYAYVRGRVFAAGVAVAIVGDPVMPIPQRAQAVHDAGVNAQTFVGHPTSHGGVDAGDERGNSGLGAGRHLGSDAMVGLGQTRAHQFVQRFTHDGAPYPKLFRQMALRRDDGIGGIEPGHDTLAQALHDVGGSVFLTAILVQINQIGLLSVGRKTHWLSHGTPTDGESQMFFA